MDGPPLEVKSFEVPKRLVFETWKKVQANGGAPGVDVCEPTGMIDQGLAVGEDDVVDGVPVAPELCGHNRAGSVNS